MNLLQEYKQQQQWRNWESYLRFIPFNSDDTVVDLGCSLGDVSRVFSQHTKNVVGIDINQEFIEFCKSQQRVNETFICSDFQHLDYSSLGEINGIWASFSLSYLSNPLDYLKRLNLSMTSQAWVALLDVSCFISGNLSTRSQYYERVRAFELHSHRSGLYDFDFGSKMQALLLNAGFDIVYFDNDVFDPELNFSGPAPSDVIEGWSARLKRMKRLGDALGSEYPGFCNEFLSNLGLESHDKRGNVSFVVAKKPGMAQTNW